jgi:hypothetical protein
MSAKRLSRQDETQLISWAKMAQGLVEDGQLPTDAIIKVAQDQGIARDMVPLLVQTYNVGRQSHQRHANEGHSILNKLAEFPLANLEQVLSEAYPSAQQKRAARRAETVAAEYSQQPVPALRVTQPRTKTACELPRLEERPSMPPRLSKAYALRDRLDRQTDELRLKISTAMDEYARAMDRLVGFFKRARSLPLEEIRFNVDRQMGPAASAVLQYACRAAKMGADWAKEAAAPPSITHAMDRHLSPYSLVHAVIRAGESLLQAKEAHAAHVKQAEAQTLEAFRPFAERWHPKPPTHVLDAPEASSQRKVASFLAGVLGGVSSGLGRGILGASAPASSSEMATGMVGSLEDASHLDELRKIEAKTIANDLMARDEDISGYDPDQVAEAYNEVVKISPGLATQPAVLRPVLRRRLAQGVLEPFEVQQLVDMEKNRRQTQGKGVLDDNGSPVLA